MAELGVRPESIVPMDVAVASAGSAASLAASHVGDAASDTLAGEVASDSETQHRVEPGSPGGAGTPVAESQQQQLPLAKKRVESRPPAHATNPTSAVGGSKIAGAVKPIASGGSPLVQQNTQGRAPLQRATAPPPRR